jgi:glucose/arabinose dehydrogenase
LNRIADWVNFATVLRVFSSARRWAIGTGTVAIVGLAAAGVLLGRRSRTEMPPYLGLPPRLELVADRWALKPVFANLAFDDPVALVQAPRTNMIFVAEREGRVMAFDNDPQAKQKLKVLNLSDVTQGEQDSGLLGLVFHPEFGDASSPNRGYAYVHYAYTTQPVHGKRPPDNKPTMSRLSRFTVDLGSFQFDVKSELVLIDQADENVFHQGGAMLFNPKDGFLYVSVGDEGSSSCKLGNCQRIDKDLFSGVLRIDVDRRGGNISHPIVRQPETGKTADYFIPNDNPFVGQPVLEEFYALGLRSPHRMTYDAVDDITWIADVGQQQREEIDVLSPGANFQWNAFEGRKKRKNPMPEVPIGIWTDPLLDLERDEAASVIGGYVYRGKLLPSLVGKYIYGDYVTGNVWALEYARDGQKVVVKNNERLLASKYRNKKNGITSFGVDAAGEIYALTLGAKSRILHLVPSTPATNAPKLLSQVGFFDGGSKEAPRGALPYTVNNPLWSDGAQKRRWMSLPRAKVRFDPRKAWRFPDGTVFVKHFAKALDERSPKLLTDLETRFFVAGEKGDYYGLTYKWNAEGTDAEVVLSRTEQELEITGLDGQVRKETYVYPGPYDCMTCHNDEAGNVLGVRTEQINHPVRGFESWLSDNPLISWSKKGVFDVVIDDPTAETYPRLAALDDESRSLEDRVRSYWAGNCSMCHGSGPRIESSWDARWSTPLAQQGILDGALTNGERLEGERVIVPGDLEKSAIFSRSTATATSLRMPPIGRRQVDPDYARVLEQWILSLPAKHARAGGHDVNAEPGSGSDPAAQSP